jgi:hypothetical protein
MEGICLLNLAGQPQRIPPSAAALTDYGQGKPGFMDGFKQESASCHRQLPQSISVCTACIGGDPSGCDARPRPELFACQIVGWKTAQRFPPVEVLVEKAFGRFPPAYT